ncbi:hypothetical protein BYT27DRAFT_6704108 [Phlegmacium glaucopus]|nr:hypothetical protein BYT27DRAFT_6704108 [Phlegmacium glaucopus]
MAALNYSWWCDDSELSQPSESDTSSDEDPEPTPVISSTRKVSEVRPTKVTRPSTQQATKEGRDRIAAKSLPYLKSPRTTTYSLSSLHEMMTSGNINLDPEYQRAVVWTTQKQESLIDSFYHNFYVPPIIFATTTREEDGAEMRTCIDGKQRLTSMRLFMDGVLSHKDSVSGHRSWFSNPKGSKRRLITPQWQSKFRNTQITCVEYDDITEEQQREIFQRVQMGVSLTSADRLQSANGSIADLIREVRMRINSTEGFEGYLNWGKARGKDFKALAEIAYLITHAKTAKSEPTFQRLKAFLENRTHPASAVKRHENFLAILRPTMPNIMDIFCRIVQHPALGEPLRENLSPLEFIMSAYLVFLYREVLSDTQLSHAIAQMRQDARSSFKNMKFDTAKCKYLLTFIHENMLDLIPKLKSDGCGDIPAIQTPCQGAERKFGDRFKDAKVEGTTKPAIKRKRKDLEDEKNNVADSDNESLQAKKDKLKRKRSRSDVGSGQQAIYLGPPPKPRATSRPSLNAGRSSAPVSEAKTKISKRTLVKQQSTSSHVNDIKKSTKAQSMPMNQNKGLQVATPSVKPPSSTRTVSGPSQKVISKLGVHLVELVPLGRRAAPVRTAVLPPTALAIPATQTQAAPPPSISQGGQPLLSRQGRVNNSPVVQQSILAPSSSSRMPGSVLPPDASPTLRMTNKAGPDRLAPVRSAKAASSSRSASMAGSTIGPVEARASPTMRLSD